MLDQSGLEFKNLKTIGLGWDMMLNMKFPNGEISEETLIFTTDVHDVEHQISKRKKSDRNAVKRRDKRRDSYFHYGCT